MAIASFKPFPLLPERGSKRVKEDQIQQINENDSHTKGDCQMLGFLHPDGILVMSQGCGKNAGQAGVVAMPIAQLFVQHKKPTEQVTPRARVS